MQGSRPNWLPGHQEFPVLPMASPPLLAYNKKLLKIIIYAGQQAKLAARPPGILPVLPMASPPLLAYTPNPPPGPQDFFKTVIRSAV